MTAFNDMFELFEKDFELYTSSEFYSKMISINDVYSIKITKIKLKERNGEFLRFVIREGSSNMILLVSVRHILCKIWYQEKKKCK